MFSSRPVPDRHASATSLSMRTCHRSQIRGAGHTGKTSMASVSPLKLAHLGCLHMLTPSSTQHWNGVRLFGLPLSIWITSTLPRTALDRQQQTSTVTPAQQLNPNVFGQGPVEDCDEFGVTRLCKRPPMITRVASKTVGAPNNSNFSREGGR